MSCQQLTVVCIFMTTCQIASGQFSFVQRLALSRNYPNSLVNHGVLRRPPSGYHYETMRHILNNYPRNSYTIKKGLSNIVRSNNNNGGSTPSRGAQKNPNKSNKMSKSEDEDDVDNTSSPTTDNPTDSPSTETPPAETPPAETPPAETPPATTTE